MSETPNHTPRSRDAALRRLASSNRWLIAGSAALTGIFTAVAANAFPGHTVKTSSATTSARKATTTPRSLSKPSRAPESDESAEEEGFESTEEEAAGAGEESTESEPSFEEEGSEESFESSEPESTEVESVPEVEAPIVSGGS